MVSAQLSLSDTAVYSIGFYIAVLIEIPKRTINQIATPILSQHIKNNDLEEVRSLYKQIANNQFLIGSLIFSLIWINTDLLFRFMPNGQIYASGKYVILIIGIAKLFEMLMGASSAILHNSNYYAWNFATSALAIFSAIGLNYWLIPTMGINGAALATLSTIFLLYASMTLIVKIKMNLHPFTFNQIKTGLGLIIGIAFGFYPIFGELSLIDPVIKSLIIITVYFLLVTKANVSPEIDQALRSLMRRLKF
jgi:O-antigen/teichoic acid export membrane protein